MKIEKSFEIGAPRARVWEKFRDVYFVAECLPGASIVGELGDNRYKGRMSVKVGPMAAAFNGEVTIETNENLWTGSVAGKGADSGSSSRATGTMTYVLAAPAPSTTRVEIVSDINLAGPLAQFSKGPIVQEIANRITSTFVSNFEARLSELGTAETSAASAPASPRQQQAQSFDAGGLLWAVLRARVRGFFRTLFGRKAGR